MSRHLRALMIEDSALDVELLVAHLERGGFDVAWQRVETPPALRAALAERSWDVALCDFVMPRMSGPQALAILRTEAPDLPAITVSGQIGEEFAVDVMRAGARDYVRKDNLSRLIPAIERELQESEERRKGERTRKGAEAALRESEERFAHAFHDSPIAMSLLSLEDFTYREVNTALERESGFSRDEVIGRTPVEVGWFVDSAAITGILQDVRQTGHARSRPCTLRSKDGSLRQVLVSASIVSRQGSPYLIAATVDITEREQVAAELRALAATLEHRVAEQTAALSAANAELQAFNDSVSHDLRAPLRQIDGFIGILERDYAASLPAPALRCIAQVQNASTRMSRMIEALARLSRVGRSAVERQSLDLSAVVRAAWTDLTSPDNGPPVEFVAGDLPTVCADPTLVREVFDNLLGNAIKFTRPVASPRVEVGVEEHDGQSACYVRDNGVGFDSARAEGLFAPFQRLHASEQFEGTGIGLSIVRRIVEMHGGRVWARSAPGHGATFYFTLDGMPERGQADQAVT